jgi:hypothetical protein
MQDWFQFLFWLRNAAGASSTLQVTDAKPLP